MAEIALCSKCEENPRADEDSSNPWCKPCRAKYQKEYQADKLTRERAKGFAAGVEAAMKSIAAEFFRGGNAMVSCQEVAAVIEQAPRPQPREVQP